MEPTPSRRDFIKGGGAALGGALLGGRALEAAEAPPAGAQAAPSSPGARFRALVSGGEPVLAPGAHDVMTARMIEDAGFPAMVVGGSACSAVMHGIPDVGLVTITELIEYAGRIARSVAIPAMADGDDGGGTPINVYRSVRLFGKAGVGAVMIEDTHQAKHLGEGESLLPAEAFADKVRAAADAAAEAGLVVIARSDALSLGLTTEEAFRRGAAYAQAGADMIYLSGLGLEDCPRAADAVGRPLMQTVGNAPLEEIAKNRVTLAVFAGQLLGVAMGASWRALQQIKATGVVPDYQDKGLPRGVQARLDGRAEVVARAKKYHVTE